MTSKKNSKLNICYSMDMVRLSGYAFKPDCESFFNSFKDNPDVEYWISNNFKSYKHNFKISGMDYVFNKEYSFWVGISHNTMNNNQGIIDLAVEFNPNKVSSDILNDILKRFFLSNDFTKVKSFDLAIDIPVGINDLIIFKRAGNMSYKRFDYGKDNITHYYGNKSIDGFVKVYNKGRELGIDDKLTRYEITFRPNEDLGKMFYYEVDKKKFLDINMVNNLQFDIDLQGTDKVLVLACLEHIEYMDLLGRDKKKKIKGIIKSIGTAFSFDFNLINTYIQKYFNALIVS